MYLPNDSKDVSSAHQHAAARIEGHRISAVELKAAHAHFELIDPRDLFYRAATELVDLALKKSTPLSVAEALTVLLQTWNIDT